MIFFISFGLYDRAKIGKERHGNNKNKGSNPVEKLFYKHYFIILIFRAPYSTTDFHMQNDFVYPFGEAILKIRQLGSGDKAAFILGFYGCTVHAKWTSASGGILIEDLPVASEPELFWTGENGEEIIARVDVPIELGKLTPSESNANGRLGKIFIHDYLEPLQLSRTEVWLCNLVPYSQVYLSERLDIAEVYMPLCEKHCLPVPNIPDFKTAEFRDSDRILEVLQELDKANSDLIITLGDEPLKYFIRKVSDCGKKSIKDFLNDGTSYGTKVPIKIHGKSYDLLPLCHPRQTEGITKRAREWKQIHKDWMERIN